MTTTVSTIIPRDQVFTVETTYIDTVCPPWCRVTREGHLEELAFAHQYLPEDWGILHKSNPSGWATVAVALQADGTSQDDDEPPNVLGCARDLLSIEDAEEAARDYTAAAGLLRRLEARS